MSRSLEQRASVDQKQSSQVFSYIMHAGLTFEAALREYLESFRLPGESQKIYRILESWSRQFFRQCPGFFRSADAVLILAFSLVLLNTDKHNRTVRYCSAYEDSSFLPISESNFTKCLESVFDQLRLSLQSYRR